MKPLRRIKHRLFWLDANGVEHDGDCSDLRGEISPRLWGNCSDLRGEVSPALWGDCSDLSGDCTGLYGNCTGLSGDCTGIPPAARPCNISDWVEESRDRKSTRLNSSHRT